METIDPTPVQTGEPRPVRERTAAETLGDELFEQIALERSHEAFDELYDLFSARAFARIFRIVRSEEDARDIVQEVFTAFWEKAPELYKMHTNSIVWILQLARHSAIDATRSPRFRHTESFTDYHETLFEEPHAPDEDLNAESIRIQIRDSMDVLSEGQRKIMEFKIAGKSYQEIADALQIPVGTVRKSVFDSYRKLRPLLDAENPGLSKEKKIPDKKAKDKSVTRPAARKPAKAKVKKLPQIGESPRTHLFENLSAITDGVNPEANPEKEALLNELEALLNSPISNS